TLGIALGLAIAQVLEVTLGQFHAVGVMAQQVALDQHPADYRGDLGTCLGIEEQLFDEALKRLWCDKTHSVTSFGARGTLPRARQSLASSGNRAISKTSRARQALIGRSMKAPKLPSALIIEVMKLVSR